MAPLQLLCTLNDTKAQEQSEEGGSFPTEQTLISQRSRKTRRASFKDELYIFTPRLYWIPKIRDSPGVRVSWHVVNSPFSFTKPSTNKLPNCLFLVGDKHLPSLSTTLQDHLCTMHATVSLGRFDTQLRQVIVLRVYLTLKPADSTLDIKNDFFAWKLIFSPATLGALS